MQMRGSGGLGCRKWSHGQQRFSTDRMINVREVLDMKAISKIALAGTLGLGLAVASAMNIAQADPRHHRGDEGWRAQPHKMHIGERCAEHPRVCASRHARRAAKREYRFVMREIRAYRASHGMHHRHHHRYERDAMRDQGFGHIGFRADIR